MSRKVDQKVLMEAQEAMKPKHLELSQSNFYNYLSKIKDDA